MFERFSALLGLLAFPLLSTQQEHSLTSDMLTWVISALATLGVIVRPFDLPEAIWAVAGASLLVVLGLIPLGAAWTGMNKGVDVYLFLIGMMLLSEVAREEGLFDWLAAKATAHASGSPVRLFALIYLVGVLVTVFLSNDATAVVLTPAVCAAARAAKVKNPKPYLLICAFTANAASFVLPISNPANLVLYGAGHVPPLDDWLAMFLFPSIISIVVTYFALLLTQRQALADDSVAPHDGRHHLSFTAKAAAAAIVSTAGVLLACSRYGYDLGLPTFLAGLAASAIIIALRRHDPVRILRGISWSIIPLVAGLFVLVEALTRTGLIQNLAAMLADLSQHGAWGPLVAGLTTAIASNLANNLPVGLIASGAIQQAHAPNAISSAILLGVDLGPNLSVTGSLATILWLTALRRDGLNVTTWQFLKTGTVVMFPALALSLLVPIAHG